MKFKTGQQLHSTHYCPKKMAKSSPVVVSVHPRGQGQELKADFQNILFFIQVSFRGGSVFFLSTLHIKELTMCTNSTPA